MKNIELETLVKGIVRNILKEIVSLSSSDVQQMVNTDPTLDPNVPPTDAQTPAEKARMERDAEMTRQKDIKQKQIELDARKKEMEFNKKKLDQQKRFDIPNLNKDIQKLKGASLNEDGEGNVLQRRKANSNISFYYLKGRTVGGISCENEDGTDAAYHAPTMGNKVVDRGTKRFKTTAEAEEYLKGMLSKHGYPVSSIEDITTTPQVKWGTHEFDNDSK